VNNATWTWIGGDEKLNHVGSYGEKDEYSTDYIPSSRQTPITWYDTSARKLWLFGGAYYFGT